MPADQIRGIVSFIGLLTQFGGALFLALLFLLLHRNASRRLYFALWGAAWALLSIALSTIVVRYSLAARGDDLLLAQNRGLVRALFFFYQSAKLHYVLLVLAGTLAYVRGIKTREFFPPAVVLTLMYASLSVVLARESRMVLVWQAPPVALTMMACAVMLLRLPRSRRSLGSVVCASALAASGALWLLYLVAFGMAEVTNGRANGLVTLLFYSGYLDVMLQALVGYGMVLVFMEDTKREADDAHAELAVAHDQLRRAALYDPLTGALNRRAFLEGVGLESAKATFGTVLMLDMDNLKLVNDSYGHAAGDELLEFLVGVLRVAVRPSDRVYRWGGDEFLLVLPGAQPGAVQPRIERALREAAPLLLSDGSCELPLLVSSGAASFAGAEELDRAINRADEAMYWQKNQRKQRPPLRVVPMV